MITTLLALMLAGPVRPPRPVDRPPPIARKKVGCAKTIQGSSFSYGGSNWSTLDDVPSPAPVVTQNALAGPPGSCSTGAVRLQVAAGTTSYNGIVINMPPDYGGSGMCSGGTSNISWGFWAYSATNVSLDMAVNDNANGWHSGGSCALTGGTWAFCKNQNIAWWTNTNIFAIGALPGLGGSQTGAIDVYLYAPKCVVAATISP